ncbi:MAG TPA: hypothetical protein VN783_16200 [Thermoanaerobaculia bacterium]|nr:hypothetical protein [Thermoanaerobaculia bacterium]
MIRADAAKLSAVISIYLALLSLDLGVIHRACPGALPCWVGPTVVGFWVLVPPIWFWSEWVVFSSKMNDPREREHVQHLHDLSRNVWLALIAILIALFDLKIFSGG